MKYIKTTLLVFGTRVFAGLVLRLVRQILNVKKPTGHLGDVEMENKGIQIEKCPRCGKHGLLLEKSTVTNNGVKRYAYRKLNVAHYSGYGISNNGKQVDRIHWCYLNSKQLQSVRQTFTQNVTQNMMIFV